VHAAAALRRVHEAIVADVDADVAHLPTDSRKNTRSPGRNCRRSTGVALANCSAAVRGTAIPTCRCAVGDEPAAVEGIGPRLP